MGFPKVSVIFKAVASSAIKRGERGVVALILKDAKDALHKLETIADMPNNLSTENKKFVQDVFMGAARPPKNVYLIMLGAESLMTEGLNVLEKLRVDYVAAPGAVQEDQEALATFIKSMRDEKRKMTKAVVAEVNADHEGVINFATSGIVVNDNIYTAAQYTARIAGVLAGTPANSSVTFLNLPEVDDVPFLTDIEKDAAINRGELILVNDGRQCKIARGINSLTSLSDGKSEQLQKIKVMDILDLIHDDIKSTAEDNYIGKVTNSYDNACLLMSAINGYLVSLERDGVLSQDMNRCSYDIEAKADFLKEIGKYEDGMKEIDIKLAPSRDKVFLQVNLAPLDVMESITIVCTL